MCMSEMGSWILESEMECWEYTEQKFPGLMFLISLEGTDPHEHNSDFSVTSNHVPHWKKNCGGKGNRKLIELILFITVACFPSGLFQRPYYLFNQKNKPEVGLHYL